MINLHPNWISGFVDGEGCFSVSFSKRNGWIEVRPSFSVCQSGKRFCHILKALETFFGCGGIRFSANDGTYKYEVRSLEDLQTRILPHFEKYPLESIKRKDWEKLCRICALMKRNLHKNKKGLIEIIDIAYTMNQSGKRKYMKEELLQSIGS